MDSSAVFWVTALLMSVLAVSFIAMPLVKRGRRNEPVGIGTALPAFAAALYMFVGSPQAASLDERSHPGSELDPGAMTKDRKSVASVANLVDGLAERLSNERHSSSDGKSWLLLARSYEHLGRITEAKAAYERATALGEYDKSLATLSDELPAVSGAALRGNVSLSASAQDIVLPTDTVFVFARAVDGATVPIAAMQRPASELPFDFVLSDRQSLSADALLSSFETVSVTARVSRSGAASDALKDLVAKSPNIAVADGETLNLTIE